VELVTSFKATFEEVEESDAILHVIDHSAAESAGRGEAVGAILEEIGASDIPCLKVFNKIDLLPDKAELLRRNGRPGSEGIYISAAMGEGISALKDRLRSLLFGRQQLFYMRIPKDDAAAIISLTASTRVLQKRKNGDYYELQVMAEPQRMLAYAAYLDRGEKAR
jgi:GTP-binding protein HflX